MSFCRTLTTILQYDCRTTSRAILLLVCLILQLTLSSESAHAEQPAEVVYSRSNGFNIPFQLDAEELRKLGATEIQLYVSTDQGAAWELHEAVAPQAGKFTFRAPREGEYWFSVRTLTTGGLAYPSGSHKPELKVRVDRTPPVLKLDLTEIKAGRVELTWDAQDSSLLSDSLKIEFRDAEVREWEEVLIRPTPAGRTSWSANAAGIVEVRGRIADHAGNVTEANTRTIVAGKPTNGRSPERGRPIAENETSNAIPSSTQLPGAILPESMTGDSLTAENQLLDKPQLADNTATNGVALRTDSVSVPRIRPAVSPNQPAGLDDVRPARTGESIVATPDALNDQRSPLSREQTSNLNLLHPENVIPSGKSAPSVERMQTEQSTAVPTPNRGKTLTRLKPEVEAVDEQIPAAISEEMRNPETVTGSVPENAPPQQAKPQESAARAEQTHAPRPARQATTKMESVERRTSHLVNVRDFQIAYEVDNVGPTGIDSIDLYITENNGDTWFHYGQDSDKTSPFAVTVPRDGEYGFSFRIRNGAGVVAPPPQPGEKPEIQVIVDATPPQVQLFPPQPGPRTNLSELLIRWTATDRQLDAAPVAISVARHESGPWQLIRDWGPNTGQFLWEVPDELPEEFLVRLEVRDAAGNLTRVSPEHPVRIDRSRPRARITDIEVPRR